MGRWIGAQAVALEVGGGGGGGGLCLEETKAREVKIKLLLTNSLFDQAARAVKGPFLPKVRGS